MKNIFMKVSKVCIMLAMAFTTVAVNSTCYFLMYQPELPEDAKCLKKHEA